MDNARERLLAFQMWDLWLSDLLSVSTPGTLSPDDATLQFIVPKSSPLEDPSLGNKANSPHSSPKILNKMDKQNGKLFRQPFTKTHRIKASSKANPTTTGEISRKTRFKRFSSTYCVTGDLECKTKWSTEWNNCHSGEADSETDSMLFLRLSELRSETDDTLPRPHVSPPLPPHKLEKKASSKIQSILPQPKEEDESNESDVKRGKKEEWTKEEKISTETEAKVDGKIDNPEDKMLQRHQDYPPQSSRLETSRNPGLFCKCPHPSDRRVYTEGLNARCICLRRTEMGCVLCKVTSQSRRMSAQSGSAEMCRTIDEEEAEALNIPKGNCGDLSNIDSCPPLVKRWAQQEESIEAIPELSANTVEGDKEPTPPEGKIKESEHIGNFVEETTSNQLSGTDSKSKESSPDLQASGRESVIASEWEMEELVVRGGESETSPSPSPEPSVKSKVKQLKTRMPQKSTQHLNAQATILESPRGQKRKTNRKLNGYVTRPKFAGRAYGEEEEEKNATGAVAGRRGNRSTSRRRKRSGRRKARRHERLPKREHRRGKRGRSRRRVPDHGDESESKSITTVKECATRKIDKESKRKNKHKHEIPTAPMKSHVEDRNTPKNLFEAAQQTLRSIDWKNPVASETKRSLLLRQNGRSKGKMSTRTCVKQRLDRNNNAMCGREDDTQQSNTKPEVERRSSVAVVKRERKSRTSYPCPVSTCSRKSFRSVEPSDEASPFPCYLAPPPKFSDKSHAFTPAYSSTASTISPSGAKKRRKTLESVKLVPTDCRPPKVACPKSRRPKRKRCLRRVPSFKDQLNGYSRKGQHSSVEYLLSQLIEKYAFNLRDYVGYLRGLRNKNNASKDSKVSAGGENSDQWTPKEASEFEEYVCFLTINTADIDDAVLPFRASNSRHKLLARAFDLYKQSLQEPQVIRRKGDDCGDGSLGDYEASLKKYPFNSLLWTEMCQLPADHPVRCVLRKSSSLHDRRIFAVENEIGGRIILAEDNVVFVHGLPCFKVHIFVPSAEAIGVTLILLQNRLPSLYAKLIITERLPIVNAVWGDKCMQAPTKGNFTTHFNSSSRMASRITVIHAPLSANPEDRREYASYCTKNGDPELEQVTMSQKVVGKPCTYR